MVLEFGLLWVESWTLWLGAGVAEVVKEGGGCLGKAGCPSAE